MGLKERVSPLALSGLALSSGSFIFLFGYFFWIIFNTDHVSGAKTFPLVYFSLSLVSIFALVICTFALVKAKRDKSIVARQFALQGIVSVALVFLGGFFMNSLLSLPFFS